MKIYIDMLRRRPDFRFMWLASVVSLAGDWFNTIASVIIVSRYTSSSLAIGGIFILRTLPQFLVGPIAGVVADRFNRKMVMVISDIVRAAIVLGFLFIDRPERLWLIYLLTGAQFVVSAFFQPASSAILPHVINKEELVTGNVLNSITWSAMLAIGAAIGGGVAALFGPQIALIIDAITYLFSAGLVAKIQLTLSPLVDETKNSGWEDMLEGFRYVLTNRSIGFLTLVKGMGQFGTGDIISAIYASQLFVLGAEGATSLGLLYTASGIGAIVGPIIGTKLNDKYRAGFRNIIQAGFVVSPLGWLVMGLAPSIWIAMLGIFLRMLGTSSNWTFSNVLLQREVPDKYLGRVFALDFAIFTLVSAVVVGLTGWLMDNVFTNPRQIAYAFSVGSLIGFVVWMRYMRHLNDRTKST